MPSRETGIVACLPFFEGLPRTRTGTIQRDTMKYFAMFTDNGNLAVENLVNDAIAKRQSWNEVQARLSKLSQKKVDGIKRYAEATDTDVEDHVYAELVRAKNEWDI
jgi:hypothetical protein